MRSLLRGAIPHLILLAAGISAIKVVLFTSGTAILLSRTGAEGMPWFYIALAAMAMVLSIPLAAVVDRLSPVALLRTTLIAAAAAALVLFMALAFEHPVIFAMTLATGHLYEIVTDIVLWLVVGLYLTSYETRRATSWLLTATAAGGLVGGLLAGWLAGLLGPQRLLLAVPPLAALVLAQLTLLKARLRPIPGGDAATPGGEEAEEPIWAAVREIPDLLRRHPLAILIASSSFVLTLVYSISEYLAFAAYQASFPDEAELASFMALVFGILQASELVFLLVLSRVLVERAGPVLRNTIFPVLACLSLVGFFFGPRLAGGLLTHITTESLSNALYEPATNSNYAALPWSIHGRVRALANGLLYPAGLAVGGGALLVADALGGANAAFALGIGAAVLFVVLAFAVGRMFLGALIQNLRGGVRHFMEMARLGGRSTPEILTQIRDLARVRSLETAKLAVELAHHVEPGLASDSVEQLLKIEDLAFRARLSSLLLRLPNQALAPILHRLAASTVAADRLLAIRILLARPALRSRHLAELVAASPEAAISGVAQLVLLATSTEGLTPSVRQALAGAPPDEQRFLATALAGAAEPHALEVLCDLAGRLSNEVLQAALEIVAESDLSSAPAVRFVHLCLARGDAQLRLMVVALASRPGFAEPQLLARLLEDEDARVRQAAAAGFAGRGREFVKLAGTRLDHPRPAVRRAAIAAIGAAGGNEARGALVRVLAPHHEFAARGHAWMKLLARPDRPTLLDELAAAIENRCREAVEIGLAVLAALDAGYVVQDLRAQLAASDLRQRANALEALASLKERHLVRPLLPLLERMIRPDQPTPTGTAVDWLALAHAAAVELDPWIRRTGLNVAARLGQPVATRDRLWMVPEPNESFYQEASMDRILALKQVSFFRGLPLDTLARLDKLLMTTSYRPEDIISQGAGSVRRINVLVQGSAILRRDGQAERLLHAPATFGETCVIDENVPPPNVVAREPCQILAMSATTFYDLAREHPEIWVEVARVLAHRLDGADLPAQPPDQELAA